MIILYVYFQKYPRKTVKKYHYSHECILKAYKAGTETWIKLKRAALNMGYKRKHSDIE